MYQKTRFLFASLTVLCFTGLSLYAQTSAPALNYHDARNFPVINQYHQEPNFNRLPASYKATVRPAVWALSMNSAGIAIRFRSNATNITARWKVMHNANMAHMTATGVKGLDLYALVNNQWQFVNSGIPEGSFNFQRTLLQDGDPGWREYLLFLPLYDGVDSLSIGIENGAEITAPQQLPLSDKQPIVYYGSSIIQGGCASRPGMAITNILTRRLQRPVINLGFSGNGMFESAVGAAICETKPALLIIDCNPNTAVELIHERAVKLVQQLRACHPTVPVLLVENYLYTGGNFHKAGKDADLQKRAELRKAFDDLIKAGVKNLHYQSGDGLIGDDLEGTIDSVHPTDIGMERFATKIQPMLQRLLKAKS
ncbi:SGNH/GDSL hydrolase family protein [Chitinophaga nivalis]|uniref:SGNH/GDSL hydrolase family protein n=1 Tax=Chitinophaga nivalis TaxID=2991709 RepID=A0ABT3IHS6_9BACT|nr:SGNH/GDSL hydrolase family protein [Chitinophaga nivalis]MCW3466794.1 SGNH/GDSL hydrolase family protein [Chitinophaga nivalis]MCW3483515.1 SGNH/GDSL hydrolase family protein [Chitinophaga nivalis]